MLSARKLPVLFALLIVLSIAGLTLAQPGGGGNRPDANRPTLAMPTLQATRAAPTFPPTSSAGTPVIPTRQSEQRQPTLTITAPGQRPQSTFTPGGLMQITPSGDWMSSITVPEDMPASAEELQAALDSYDLPYDMSSLENAEMPPSSDVAYAAIVGFAQQYLGIAVAPIYAAEFNTDTARTRPTRQQPTGEMSAELEAIASQFPEEIQTMLANASGIAYAGLMSNGVAVVYTGECSAAQCSISMDNIQFEITQESLGAYGVYVVGTVTDANAALALIKAVYPALNTIPLAQTTVETGYAFTAVSGDMQSASVIAYYAGTVSAGDYILVYAAVGVGQGYAEIVRGQ